MKKSSLNRKFRRALAASLGAVAFASTSCVINAVDQKLIELREVAKYFAAAANSHHLRTNQPVGQHVAAAQLVSGKHIHIAGKVLTLDDTKPVQKAAGADYQFPLKLNGVQLTYVRMKRQNANGGPALKRFFIAPDIPDLLPDPNTLPDADGNWQTRIIKWLQNKWKDMENYWDAEIKKQEAAEAAAKRAEDARIAEENARAERERANSLLSSSRSQNVQVPSTNFNSGTMAVTALTTAMIPMTTMMNNTTPVQTTTSSMVNTGNAMGTQAGVKTDTTNTNLQINHESHVAADKIKT